MRPKKVILCVVENERELSVLRFTLATNGYRVLVASSGQEAIAVFSAAVAVDLVVAYAEMAAMSGAELAERLKRMRRYLPVLLLGEGQPAGCATVTSDAVVASRNCTSFELLERVKLMSARKRGPRKGTLRKTAAPEMALQEA